MDSAVVQYGQVAGPVVSREFPVAASVVFKNTGGKFVQLNSSGNILIAAATVTDIIGWALTGEFTASSTAAQTKVPVNLSLDAIYELPLSSAVTEATLQGYIGKMCDITVTSDIQYANPSGTTYNIIQIVDYHYWGSAAGQQSVLVKLVAKNLTTQA